MSLRDIQYQTDYRSGYDNIVEDFVRPSLRVAREYCRAVGYFSSSALESFGAPLGEFIGNGGKIRLVCSVELSSSDLREIENGTPKPDICAHRLVQIIENEFADGVGNGTTRLARLLEIGRLEIQIAVPKSGTGIYHEKIGIFVENGDFVAFTGSANESRNAFENNRECVDVYTSWESPERAQRKRDHFEVLWDDDDEGVEVHTFPEAAKKKLLRVCGEWEAGRKRRRRRSKKWRHQEDAAKAFLSAERGVLNMATGTGKTRTALNILRSLFETDQIDTVVICTDGNDLLDQWYKELLDIRKEVGDDVRVFRHYRDRKEIQEFALDPKRTFLLLSRSSAAMALKQLGAAQGQRTLLIYDEVHGLGSPGNRDRLTGLSDDVRYRLGLSATPERPYDQDGNTFIEEDVGPVLYTFGLHEAIERQILAPFNYHPLSYTPTEEDRSRIAAIYRKKKAREVAGEPMAEAELWIELARVYKTSEAKLPVFVQFLEEHQRMLERCIIFTETMDYGRSVLEIVHRHRPDFHTYFSGEDQSTLQRFARGDLECLITCHRLSEGIDIQSLGNVILFSSERGQLETVQRIGRCLRTNPDEPGKVANVVDFIRESDDDAVPNADEQRRDWLSALSQVRPQD